MNKHKQLNQLLNPELVELVHYTTQAIAKAKGYASCPSKWDAELVLQGLYIVNVAIRAKEEQSGKDTKRQAGG